MTSLDAIGGSEPMAMQPPNTGASHRPRLARALAAVGQQVRNGPGIDLSRHGRAEFLDGVLRPPRLHLRQGLSAPGRP